MPIPLDSRKKPVDVKVHVKSGTGLDITWSDGHTSHYEFAYLRDECPCATCNDERAKKESVAAAAPGASAFTALPMFKPKARAQAASQVGNYALSITFSDGHATGIYSYEHLRTICPCPDCARSFRSAGT
jgi:DUF971 family protein